MTQKDKSEIVVAFLPHKPYHLDILKGCLSLSNRSWKAIIIDSSAYYLDPSVKHIPDYIYQHELARRLDVFPLETLLQKSSSPSALVVFNDWERTARILVDAYNEVSLPTVAIAEGVQDYQDELSHRPRFPYQSVKHVLLPCKYDKKFFASPHQSVGVIGNPRITQLAQDAIGTTPNSKKVLINYNFSYGVLSDIKDEWLKQAVEAVSAAGLEPQISVHPSESLPEGFKDYVYPLDLYQSLSKCMCVISRFSTIILESIALNIPVIYFPPVSEKIDKFRDSSSVIPRADNKKELIKILNNSVRLQLPTAQTKDFLQLHTGLHLDHQKRFSHRMETILNTSFISMHKTNLVSAVLLERLSNSNVTNNHYRQSQLRLRALALQKQISDNH